MLIISVDVNHAIGPRENIIRSSQEQVLADFITFLSLTGPPGHVGKNITASGSFLFHIFGRRFLNTSTIPH